MVKIRIIFCILATILLCLLLACGGGTSGTGIKTFRGLIRTTQGTPISEAEINLAGTPLIATTDDKGEFTIRASLDSGDAQLDISIEQLETSSVILADLPQGDVVIEFVIEVNELTGVADLTMSGITNSSTNSSNNISATNNPVAELEEELNLDLDTNTLINPDEETPDPGTSNDDDEEDGDTGEGGGDGDGDGGDEDD